MEHTIRIDRSFVKLSSENGKDWWIDDTFVPGEQRRRGIGRELVKRTLQYVKSQGGTRIGTWAPDPKAFEFWRRVGFNMHGVKRL